MRARPWMLRLRDERGASAVVIAVCMLAIFGAGVLSIDAGSAWKTKRDLVTDTDAAALAAARMFANGLADPCTSAGRAAAQAEAMLVLKANSSEARHDPVSTPGGFEVVTAAPCPAPAGQIMPGHVRFDARLLSQDTFAGVFGSGGVDTISSSTAQFGYVADLTAGGLRPIAVCDQLNVFSYPTIPSYPPTGAPFPHFYLWNLLQQKYITQAEYNAYFGAHAYEYPTENPQTGQTYLSPANGGGVVHRINAKDDCQGGSSWRGWIDLNGGSNGTSDVEDWLRHGFDGEVSLSPKHCNSKDGPGDPHCEVATGNKNGVKDALPTIQCPATTPSKDCFTFPIVVDELVHPTNGSNQRVRQVAFVWVILRGWNGTGGNPCTGNGGCEFDFEFVKIQTQGRIGRNPSGNAVTAVGTSLCGADHDTQEHRCDV